MIRNKDDDDVELTFCTFHCVVDDDDAGGQLYFWSAQHPHFVSSDRSSYSDSVLLLVRAAATFSDFEHFCQNTYVVL